MIELRKTDEKICSCSACGKANYEAKRMPLKDGHSGVNYVQNGVVLWDMRISANGYQTTVLRYCDDCLDAISSAIALRRES